MAYYNYHYTSINKEKKKWNMFIIILFIYLFSINIKFKNNFIINGYSPFCILIIILYMEKKSWAVNM